MRRSSNRIDGHPKHKDGDSTESDTRAVEHRVLPQDQEGALTKNRPVEREETGGPFNSGHETIRIGPERVRITLPDIRFLEPYLASGIMYYMASGMGRQSIGSAG